MKFRPIPTPPAFLDAHACLEFRRVFAMSRSRGYALNPLDAATVGMYAQALSDIARLSEQIRREGEVLLAPSGRVYLNPLVTALRMAEACRRGMVPVIFPRPRRKRGPRGKGARPDVQRPGELASRARGRGEQTRGRDPEERETQVPPFQGAEKRRGDHGPNFSRQDPADRDSAPVDARGIRVASRDGEANDLTRRQHPHEKSHC
jgi:hypothetical protein